MSMNEKYLCPIEVQSCQPIPETICLRPDLVSDHTESWSDNVHMHLVGRTQYTIAVHLSKVTEVVVSVASTDSVLEHIGRCDVCTSRIL